MNRNVMVRNISTAIISLAPQFSYTPATFAFYLH